MVTSDLSGNALSDGPVNPDNEALVGQAVRSANTPRERQPLLVRIVRDRVLLLCALPGMALLILFHYIPLAGNVIAFQDYLPFLGIRGSQWVGLGNFTSLFSSESPGFLNALKNTLILALIQAVFVFPVPIVLALALNGLLSERLKTTFQSILYLPHFLSWVIVVSLFQQMLGGSGLMNQFLRVHGAPTMDLMTNPHTFFGLITLQVIWKESGWATILFLAALSQVDTQLYEAAAMDGATRWGQTWHVTLPGLRSIIVLLLILKLGDSLTIGFEQIILQQAAVGREASEVLDTYVYNNGIVDGNWGVSAAVGLVKGIVSAALVFGANSVAHLFGESGVYER